MAVSKKSRALGQGAEMPDAAAFVRVLDDELAAPADVSAAYQAALARWRKGKTSAEVLHAALTDGGVAQERPQVDADEPPRPEKRLIALHRNAIFDNHVDHQEDQ